MLTLVHDACQFASTGPPVHFLDAPGLAVGSANKTFLDQLVERSMERCLGSLELLRQFANRWWIAGVNRLVGQVVMQSFGYTEVDDFDNSAVICLCHHDVGRLEIAMNDAFLVRVLHGVADIDEQFQTLAIGQLFGIAKFGDGGTVNKFHD